MTYQRKRHIELFKRYKNALKQGTAGHFENSEEYYELIDYQIIMANHLFWQNRNEIIAGLEAFLNDQIGAEDFCDFTLGLRSKSHDAVDKFKLELISNPEKVENIQPDPRSKDLLDMLSDFFDKCEYCEDMDDYETTKEEFEDSAKYWLVRFQKANLE